MRLPLANNRTVARRLLCLLKERSFFFVSITLLQLLTSLSSVGLTWSVGRTIDQIGIGNYFSGYTKILILFSFGFPILFFLTESSTRLLGQYVFARMREDLIASVAALPLSTVEAAGSGDLLGRTTHDVDSVRYLLQRGLNELIQSFFFIATCLVSAFLTDWRLSIFTILPLLPIYGLTIWYLRRAVPSYRCSSALYAQTDAAVAETANNALTIDAVGLQKVRSKRVYQCISSVLTTYKYEAYLRAILMMGGSALPLLPILAVIPVGGYLYFQGLGTLGSITIICLYCLQLSFPLYSLIYITDVLQSSLVSLQRIFGIDKAPVSKENNHLKPADSTLELKNVSFSYDGITQVLHDINLRIEPGQRLTIVGSSGSGKSTLARLIAAFNTPDTGQVTVGGVNISDLSEAQLHKEVVLLTQESHVFVGSLADNLRFACPEVTDKELEAALQAIGAWEWVIDLPEGLNTKVGSGALQLSESQAQELALARVILLNPSTLILDEATSQLDPTGAHNLEVALNRVLKNRTVITIAHRLWGVETSDLILVMQAGRIHEQGTHKELLAKNGIYNQLWTNWCQ